MANKITILENLIAVFCICIPVILRFADTKAYRKSFRPSISDYVRMKHRHVFGMVFTIAAMLFIYNGVHNLDAGSLNNFLQSSFWEERGYNIILGLALFGVMLFPYNRCEKTHFTFAGLFFVGSTIVIACFPGPENWQKWASYSIAAASIITLAVYFINKNWERKWINLFWAEWISLIVIGIHFILENDGILELVKKLS
jgi:heme O synthase-like polyprenyltransferase